jgi:ABC-type Fe3+ transport system permease subunit
VKRRLRDAPAAVLMLGASLTLLGVWTIYPLIRAIQTGHLSCDQTGRKCTEKGWGQYLDVFQSKQFQDALMVSVKLAVMTVPIGLLLGIGLAVLADKHLRGIGFFRTVFSSTVATSVAWPAWSGSCWPESACSDLFSDWIPVKKTRTAATDTALPAVALSVFGRASGSRSSSSPPACRACRGCTRAPTWMVPAASALHQI